ncbi:MAG: two-component system LytT family response regulator [Crocinitomix sp.]|jgi:two-component system LytT family response regulator
MIETKINILIIEDQVRESDLLQEALISNGFNVVGIARSHRQALELFYDLEVDLVIIDVFLNDKPEGISFAETICIVPGKAKPFVFLTSSKDRQIFERAKLTRPFAFLLKPFNELELIYAIEMAIEKFYDQEMSLTGDSNQEVYAQDHIFIKKRNVLKKVAFKSIQYFEVDGRYCNVYTEEERFVVSISMVKLTALLESSGFLRTHRNYLINAAMIKEINVNDNLIILNSEQPIPLSNTYKNIIKNFNTLS